MNIIRTGVGGINESDVMLAAASEAIIIGFNVRPVGDARSVAEREGVDIRNYSVIYKVLDELRAAMEGMLEPEEVEDSVGTVEIRQIFRASKIGVIAGSYVTDGKVTRGAKTRLVRDGTIVYDGEIASLRRLAMTSARSHPASSAASCCATSRTSRKATCWRSTRRARSTAPSRKSFVADAYVALLLVHLHFPEAGSLKAKRKDLASVKAQLHGRMGVTVAEVEHQDLWQRATLAAALTGGSPSHLEPESDRVERFLLDRFPETCHVERRLVSFDEVWE